MSISNLFSDNNYPLKVTLGNSTVGYVPTQLDYYEEWSGILTITGGGATGLSTPSIAGDVGTKTIGAKIVRIGNNCTLTLSRQTALTGTNAGDSFFCIGENLTNQPDGTVAFPERFKPIFPNNQYVELGPIRFIDAGAAPIADTHLVFIRNGAEISFRILCGNNSELFVPPIPAAPHTLQGQSFTYSMNQV